MVLDFGLLSSNLFPTSDALGEGIAAPTETKIATASEIKWVLIESRVISASTSETFTVDPYDEYQVITRLAADAVAGLLSLRLNADAGNNYAYTIISNGALAQAGNQNALRFGYANTNIPGYATLRFPGKTTNIANGRLNVLAHHSGDFGAGKAHGINGLWKIGAAVQVSSITIVMANASSGFIDVYGRTR